MRQHQEPGVLVPYEALCKFVERVDLSVGLAVIDRQYVVTKVNDAHGRQFPGLVGERCHRHVNGFVGPCAWCPVRRTFEDGKAHISLAASPYPGPPAPEPSPPPEGVVYSRIISVPMDRNLAGLPSEVLEIAFYVTEAEHEAADRRMARQSYLHRVARHVEGVPGENAIASLSLLGAVSRLGLNLDRAVLVVFAEAQRPAPLPPIDSVWVLTADARAPIESRGTDREFDGLSAPVLHDRLMRHISVHKSTQGQPIELPSVLAEVGIPEERLGQVVHHVRNRLPLPVRLSDRVGAVVLNMAPDECYGVLLVADHSGDSLLLDDDLSDLASYGAFLSVALTAKRAVDRANKAVANLERVTETLESFEAKELVFAAAKAIGFAHEVTRACGRLKGIAPLISANIPKGSKASLPLAQLTQDVDFLRECADRMTGLAKQAANRSAFRSCDIVQLVRDVQTVFAGAMEERRIQCRIAVTGEVDRISCDPLLIRQVIENLFDNAVYWLTDLHGRLPEIRISISWHHDHVIVEFLDNGPGIRPEHLHLVWKEFYSTKEHGAGLGVGLFLAKRVIEEVHQGRAEVASEYALWTKFTVTLPVSPSHDE